MKDFSRIPFPTLFLLLLFAAPHLRAQDWVHTGTNLGNDRIRIAAADFKPSGADPQTPALKAVFDATLYADLGNAGIFDLVSKSMAPQATPGAPQEISLRQWSAAPASAAMVAFGSLSATNGKVIVDAWLFDAGNATTPQILGKHYTDTASEESARAIAHRFADEIILRLGGGINGIAETKIYFISTRTGTKEVWGMDYDGQNQHQITHLGTISISPRISPDNSRLAFASLGREGWTIRMYSLELNRFVAFPGGSEGGSNQSPAWSADGAKIAFSSSRTGNPEIWLADSSGGNLHKLTAFKGPNVGPTFNPRTGAQLAWVSGRTGCRRSTPWTSTVPMCSASPTAVMPSAHPGLRMVSSSPSAGIANTAPATPAATTFTSSIWPARTICRSPTSRVATTSPPGLRMAATSCFNAPSAATQKYGPCWPMEPTRSSSRARETTPCPIGAGSEPSTTESAVVSCVKT